MKNLVVTDCLLALPALVAGCAYSLCQVSTLISAPPRAPSQKFAHSSEIGSFD